MENLKLRLNEKIDLRDISFKAKREFERNKSNKLSEDQNLIYFLIHRYSNYEKIMWSFWNQEESFVFNEIKNILLEISKLDRSLSWDCDLVLKRYKRNYFLKNAKSKWVTNENTLY
tara:strand:+ start:2282 stop:2629 length:348 start_codon:yes stop_codon:yes gene_type:complete